MVGGDFRNDRLAHKVRRVRDSRFPLVEVFRKGDWVDADDTRPSRCGTTAGRSCIRDFNAVLKLKRIRQE